MQSIALPQKIEFKKGDAENSGSVIVEPCFPGYGITLGNSIRRVLLSSLPGAAVLGVKIKGASHEFMNIPHIKEDVLEIILNLKQLRLRVHGDEVIRLELDVHGEKEVKASDIKKNSQVEIMNSDLVLANITDMAGNLNMEIFVSKGMGYEMVVNRENKNKETGYIEIDSVFTPVLSTSITVENVRVGKMTNWEKLVLNIATDGTISYEEAFKQSAKILIDQYNALIGEKKEEIVEEESKEEVKDEEVKEESEEDNIVDKSKKKKGRPKSSK